LSFRFCWSEENFVLHDVHSMETAICVGSVLFVLMLFAAHYKFYP